MQDGVNLERVYFNKIKSLFIKYETLWNNLRDMGTEECSDMRSMPDYVGVTVHENIGKNFIAYINRNLCSKKLIAFHSVLRIVPLTFQDSIDNIPKNWI